MRQRLFEAIEAFFASVPEPERPPAPALSLISSGRPGAVKPGESIFEQDFTPPGKSVFRACQPIHRRTSGPECFLARRWRTGSAIADIIGHSVTDVTLPIGAIVVATH